MIKFIWFNMFFIWFFWCIWCWTNARRCRRMNITITSILMLYCIWWTWWFTYTMSFICTWSRCSIIKIIYWLIDTIEGNENGSTILLHCVLWLVLNTFIFWSYSPGPFWARLNVAILYIYNTRCYYFIICMR